MIMAQKKKKNALWSQTDYKGDANRGRVVARCIKRSEIQKKEVKAADRRPSKKSASKKN